MRDLILFAIIFGLLPLVLVRAPVGVLLWNWIGFMNPHRLCWGPARHFEFATVVGGLTLLSFVFSKDRRMIPITPVTLTLMAFILWMCITTYFALVPEDAVNQWEKVMKIQLFIFIALSVMQDPKRIRQLVTVITLSIAYYGVKGGYFTLISGGSFRVLGPAGSQIEDNNTLALALVMIVPLLIYHARTTESKWLIRFYYLSAGLCGLSILGSQSRGAFLAGSAMVLFLVLKSHHKFKAFFALIIFVPLILGFMPESWYQRMSTIETYEADASAMGRINAWHFAYNLAKDRPLMGGGFETFRPGLFERYAPDPEAYHDSHSIYFEALGEQGFMGLFLFLMLLSVSWRLAQKLRRRISNLVEMKWAFELVSMVQVSLIGYVVGGAFLGVAYFDLVYSLIAILVLVENYVKQTLGVQVQSGALYAKPA
ncbi:MAG: putative O-glycosylation ligase, exosortase A system-associated [Gammaproteobacteria bacterium]